MITVYKSLLYAEFSLLVIVGLLLGIHHLANEGRRDESTGLLSGMMIAIVAMLGVTSLSYYIWTS